jgi:hypothetical protein
MMANQVPDRGGDPRRGGFYNLAVNRPGTGDKAWQVDAWHASNEQHLGQHTYWGSSREDAIADAHKRMADKGRLTHDVEPKYQKKFRKSRSYL